MELFEAIMSTFGAAIMLPILIFIFELCLRVKPMKAFKSAIYIGIGLNGLLAILNPYFLGLMGNAVSDMVLSGGIQLPYVDTGWGVLAALSYSTTIGAMIIPVGIVVNLILLRFGMTDTLNIDIWNFWHWAFIGTMIYYGTGNYALGLVAAVVMQLLCLLFADITGPAMRKFFNLPGLSFPHGTMLGGTLIGLLLRWPLEKLGIMKIQVNSETIRRKLGPLGDSVVIGFLVAVIIGFIAWSGKLTDMATWAGIIRLGIGTGAFIYLYPKATGALLEGFRTLSDRVREILMEKGTKREINFGMDGALCVGHPDAITTGLLSMIVAVGMVFFLPGNRFLMLANLGVTPFFLAAGIVAVMGGNIVASLIATSAALAVTFYFGTAISPIFNTIATQIGGIDVVHGAALVGADIRPLHGISFYIGQNWITVSVAVVVILGVMYAIKVKPMLKEKLSGYKEEQLTK